MLPILILMLDSPSDQDRFQKLFEHYYSYLYKSALQILKDQSLAEDAVQEAFIAIIRNFEKIEDLYSEKTRNLLYIIQKHKAIDLYNRRKRSNSVGLDWADTWERSIPGPEAELYALTTAIASLKMEYQEVLMLRYDCGYSVCEIAEFLGLTKENVKRRLTRAKSALEKKLNEEL